MGAKKPPEGYLNIPKCAKLCGVVPMTFYQWVQKGRIPHIERQAGSRTFYYIKKDDMDSFLNRLKKTKRSFRKAKLYEIVVISCGELKVLYSTTSLMELSHMYIRMMEKQHQLVRVRLDGELLTIHESDRVGNTYHPRTRSYA